MLAALPSALAAQLQRLPVRWMPVACVLLSALVAAGAPVSKILHRTLVYRAALPAAVAQASGAIQQTQNSGAADESASSAPATQSTTSTPASPAETTLCVKALTDHWESAQTPPVPQADLPECAVCVLPERVPQTAWTPRATALPPPLDGAPPVSRGPPAA